MPQCLVTKFFRACQCSHPSLIHFTYGNFFFHTPILHFQFLTHQQTKIVHNKYNFNVKLKSCFTPPILRWCKTGVWDGDVDGLLHFTYFLNAFYIKVYGNAMIFGFFVTTNKNCVLIIICHLNNGKRCYIHVFIRNNMDDLKVLIFQIFYWRKKKVKNKRGNERVMCINNIFHNYLNYKFLLILI